MKQSTVFKHIAFVVSVLSLFSGVLGLGQVNYGSFRGVVTDPTGAPIPEANVSALLNDRGFSRTTTAGPDGSWELPGLLPGTYTITVTKIGFKKYVDNSLILYAHDLRRVDVKLELGTATQSVNVSAKAAVVSTEQAAITTVQPDSWQVFRAATRTSNGPEYELRLFAQQRHSGAGGTQWVNHGAEGSETTGSMDGIEQTNLGNFRTTQFMVKEDKLWLVNAPAEFQRSGTLQSVSPNGTNHLHGTVLLEIDNTALNALGPNPAKRGPGIPSTNWEGTAGGPVVIPKLYNGRNKSFWNFVTYQSRGTSSTQSQFIYPQPTMRNGDLSIYPAQIHDLDGTPFPGNQIPANKISPVSKLIMQDWLPLPNFGGPTNLGPNYNGPVLINTSNKHYQIRGDQKIGNSNTLTGVYYQFFTESVQNFDFNPLDGGLRSQSGANGLSIQDTHVFGPHMVNEFLFTRSNVFLHNVGGNISGKAFLTGIGITSAALGGREVPDSLGAPQIDLPGFGIASGLNGIGTALLGRSQGSTITHDIRYVIKDTISYQNGRHLFKGGFNDNPRIPDSLSVAQPAWGDYAFNGFGTGNAFADFLLGVPQSTSIQGVRGLLQQKTSEIGFFFQDDFKMTPRITVNLGVRYQLYTPLVDEQGKFYNFDFVNRRVVIPNGSTSYALPSFPSAIPVVTASTAKYPNNLVPDSHLHGWEPRLGIAWRPWGNKTVFRTGYGVYHTPTQLGGATTGPFQLTETFPANTITGDTAALTFATPFPSAPGAVGPQALTAVPANMLLPYTQQWSLTVERDLGWGIGLRTSYVGAKSTHLIYTTNQDQIPPSTTRYATSRLPFQPSSVYSSVLVKRNGGNMEYHGLEFELHRKFSSGLFFTNNFNWNKTLRDSYFGTTPQDSYNRAVDKGQDPQSEPILNSTNFVYPLPLGRGKRLLNLPEGTANDILNQVVHGWTVSNVMTLSAGYRWTPTYSGFDSTGTGISTGRADVVPGCNKPTFQRSAGYWWDPSCFRIPSVDGTTNALTSSGASNLLGRFGDAAPGSLRGPGWMLFESGLFKDFVLVPGGGDKSARLRFSALFRNTFNHASRGSLSGCTTNITLPTFGLCPAGNEPFFMTPYRAIILTAQVVF